MKKNLLSLALLFTANIFAQNIEETSCSIGNLVETSDFKNGISLGQDKLMGIKFTLSQQGTLKSINIIANGTGDKYRMAVYSDKDGAPDTLVAYTDEATIGTGFTQNTVSPVLLNSGDYWVMAVYKLGGGNVKIYSESVKVTKYYTADLKFTDAFPKTGAGFTFYTGLQLLYSLTIDCGNTLSVNNLSNSQAVTVYPNPSSDYVKITGLTANAFYVIRDLSGNEVLKGQTVNQQEINISSLVKGPYFISVEGLSDAIKFVK